MSVVSNETLGHNLRLSKADDWGKVMKSQDDSGVQR